MKKFCIFCLLMLVVLTMYSCGDKAGKRLAAILPIAEAYPDSAIALLDKIDQSGLSDKDMALYSFEYTLAQDRSGLDVDDDSLIRIAYNWYDSRPDDSLYARCEYYMGKYYMLNDSSEKANQCLNKSSSVAELRNDKFTQCLALEKLSFILRDTDPLKSVKTARKVESIYSSLPDATVNNMVYAKLNLCMALLVADSIRKAEEKCQEAIHLSQDSSTLSSAYQDMADILGQTNQVQKSLWFAKKSIELDKNAGPDKMINLAYSYMDADSLDSCERILGEIKTSNLSYLYIIFYVRQIAAIKRQQLDKAIELADSCSLYIEQMYSNELSQKENYYDELNKAEYKEGVIEGKSKLLSWLIAITVLAASSIIMLVLNFYRQYKNKAKDEMRQLEIERKLHAEELKHKEIQLSTMRNYIIKKINIEQRIDEIKGNKDKHILLTDEDWKEMRLFVENVEEDFVIRLKEQFHNLTESDVNFLILLKLKLPSKAMGMIYGISEKSIRQKLFVYKSKVGLKEDKGTSLRSFIENF